MCGLHQPPYCMLRCHTLAASHPNVPTIFLFWSRYGERVGALSVVSTDAAAAKRVESQLKMVR